MVYGRIILFYYKENLFDYIKHLIFILNAARDKIYRKSI